MSTVVYIIFLFTTPCVIGNQPVINEPIPYMTPIILRGLERISQLERRVQEINVQNAVTEVIHFHTPRDIPERDFEMKSETTYICAVGGTLSGFTRWDKYTPYPPVARSDETTDITILLRGDLTHPFKHFVQHVASIRGVPDIIGSLDMRFTDVQVEVSVNLVKSSSIISNLAKNICILCIKDIKLKRFSSLKATVNPPGSLHIYSSRNSFYATLDYNRQQIRNSLENTIRTAFYETLTASGKWICENDGLSEEVHKKKEAFVPTFPERFKKYCKQ